MKKTATILSLTLFVSISVSSQVSITTADLPLASQNYNLVQALPLELADPALSAGMDMTWNYSNLEPLNTTVQSFIPVSATPFLYQFLFGQANHASAGEDLEIGEMLSFTDVYNYFRNDATGYYDLGFGSSFNGFPLIGQRNPTDRILQLPLEFGNEPDENNSYYQIAIPTLATIRNWQTRLNIIDGWGSVTTPTGTFEALRVRSVLNIVDSILISFEEEVIVQGFTRPETIEYRWLSPGMGVPVLQINTIAGQITQVTYRGENSTIGIEELKEESISIFPNPAYDFVQVVLPEYAVPLTIQLIDAAGRVQNADFVNNGNQVLINTSKLSSGLYQIQLLTNDRMFSGKVMVKR
jgi:hypothetical protein